MAGLEVFGVILGGYASGSKWSLYGAMREAAQVVSYEIPLGLCVVVPVLIAGTHGPGGHRQRARPAGSSTGTCCTIPFTFVTFWIYVTCAMAGTNRAPFDLPEAESELVAGFMTEYSGFRWSIFFMAEYTAMFVVSGLAAMLFLGGWNGPVPVAAAGWGLPPTHRAQRRPGRAGSATCWACAISSSKVDAGRDVHDVAPLDAAAAADRPGDDHLPEILRAAGLDDAGRRDALDVLLSRRPLQLGFSWVRM